MIYMYLRKKLFHYWLLGHQNNHKNYYVKAIKGEEPKAFTKVLPTSDYNQDIWVAGGRKSALKILKGLDIIYYQKKITHTIHVIHQ